MFKRNTVVIIVNTFIYLKRKKKDVSIFAKKHAVE